MKKIKDNSLWGLIAMGMNVVILVLVIVSGVKLNSFDKENVILCDSLEQPYTILKDSVDLYKGIVTDNTDAINFYEKSMMQLAEDAEIHKQKLDALDAKYKPAAAKKKGGKKAEVQEMTESQKLERDSINTAYFNDTLHYAMSKAKMIELKDTVAVYSVLLKTAETTLAPVQKAYDDQLAKVAPLKASVKSICIVTLVLLLMKIVVFAIWLFLNTRTIANLTKWKNRNYPCMALISWIIPIYNLFKPCAIFSGLVKETNELLKNKSIVSDIKDDAHLEFMGLWWGSALLSAIVFPLVLWATYFGESGFYFYLRPHTAALIVALIVSAFALLFESYLIFKYNKNNKILCNNQAKFEK